MPIFKFLLLILLFFFSQNSISQEVYGVFGLPSPNIGSKQVGTVNPGDGSISLLGMSTSVDSNTLVMTTGATAINVAGNKSYFIAKDSLNVDRIYTVDLDTGITDSNPALTAGYTTSNNWGVWYDEPNAILYALFDRGTDVEIAIVNTISGVVTQHDAAVVASGAALGSGLLTGDSSGQRLFFMADEFIYVVDTSNTNTHYALSTDDFWNGYTASNIFGLEWDKTQDALWVLYNPGSGGRSLAKIEGDISDGGEPEINTNIELDFGDSITTSSGLSCLDTQSSKYFFFGRPSSGANANKWSMYTVDLINESSTNVNIEDSSVQTNGYAGIEVLPGPELSFSKSDGDISTTPGSIVTYTLNYANAPGTGATSGLKITETVPAETTFVPLSSSVGWTCTPGNNAGSTCEISPGELSPGGNSSVTFAVQLNSYVSASFTEISNSATLSANNAVNSEIASDTTPVTAAAILAVTKSDGDVTDKVPGDTITYQITASNTGNRTTANALLTETVPISTTFNSGASTVGWTCLPTNNAGSTCTYSVGSLSGTPDAVNFAVDVISSMPAGATEISNSVTFSADGVSSAQASDTTPITSAAALSLTKNDADASVVPGSSVTYQLDYGNTGNQDAANVVLTETVLDETTFDVANSSAGWTCLPDINPGSTCTYLVGTLGGNDFGSVDFALLLNNPVSDTITQLENTASVSADNAQTVNAQDNTPIIASVNLRMVKSDGDITASLERIVNYSLIYFNDGDRNAVGVELTETVPANTTFQPLSSTPGWNCLPDNSAGSSCSFSVGSLVGGGKSVTFFAVKVDETLDISVTELSNTATVNATNAPSSSSDTELTPVDGVVPVVNVVDASPSISGITQCSQNDAMISSLFVEFEDDNSGLQGVDSLNNYMLIDTGSNQDLETTECGVVSGDDVSMTLSNLVVGGTSTIPTSTFDIGMSLKDGVYALLICDGITDAAGNLLDGNNDGLQGGDLVRIFRVEQGNLFDNAFLDDCPNSTIQLPPWTSLGGDVDSDTDSYDSSISGSVELISVDGSEVNLSQCIESVPANGLYALETSVLGTPIQSGDLDLSLSCNFSDAASCGTNIGTHSESYVLAASVTPQWEKYITYMPIPANTVSAECTVSLSSPTNQEFVNYLDELDYKDGDLIYMNGFEISD